MCASSLVIMLTTLLQSQVLCCTDLIFITFHFSGQIVRKRKIRGRGSGEGEQRQKRQFLVLETEYMVWSAIDSLSPDPRLCPFLTYQNMHTAVLLGLCVTCAPGSTQHWLAWEAGVKVPKMLCSLMNAK